MNGVWFAGSMKPQPSVMTISTIDDLEDDDQAVDERGLLRAADQQEREQEEDADRRHVHDSVDRSHARVGSGPGMTWKGE